MDLLSLIPDNITEVLVGIVRFTELRRLILHANIHSVDVADFTPRDLPVREFSDVLNEALAEHLTNHRLLFRDTPNITFGPGNSTRVRSVVDTHALTMLRKSRDEYLELQVNRLLENALNRKVAAELLKQKCGVCPDAMGWNVDMALADDSRVENTSTHCDTIE